MAEELRPCPFCGGEARIIAKPYEPKVCVGCDDDTCLGFSGLGWLYDSEQEAAEAWNRRAWCDRDALLALADEIEDNDVTYLVSTQYVLDSYADRIREALGVTDG